MTQLNRRDDANNQVKFNFYSYILLCTSFDGFKFNDVESNYIVYILLLVSEVYIDMVHYDMAYITALK